MPWCSRHCTSLTLGACPACRASGAAASMRCVARRSITSCCPTACIALVRTSGGGCWRRVSSAASTGSPCNWQGAAALVWPPPQRSERTSLPSGPRSIWWARPRPVGRQRRSAGRAGNARGAWPSSRGSSSQPHALQANIWGSATCKPSWSEVASHRQCFPPPTKGVHAILCAKHAIGRCKYQVDIGTELRGPSVLRPWQ
mmetsp:Transcript_56549/g.165372  ORF Transcript_56549/g.165372 Transcript_56549/m.165372 type:complete len:200 (+) Transcript_56549:169-768(+)